MLCWHAVTKLHFARDNFHAKMCTPIDSRCLVFVTYALRPWSQHPTLLSWPAEWPQCIGQYGRWAVTQLASWVDSGTLITLTRRCANANWTVLCMWNVMCILRRGSTSLHSNFTWMGWYPSNHSWRQKARDTGLPDSEDRIPLCFLILTQYLSVMDTQSDRFAVAYTALAKTDCQFSASPKFWTCF